MHGRKGPSLIALVVAVGLVLAGCGPGGSSRKSSESAGGSVSGGASGGSSGGDSDQFPPVQVSVPSVAAPDPEHCIVEPLPVDTGISSGNGKVTGTLRVFCGAEITRQEINMKLLFNAGGSTNLTEAPRGFQEYHEPEQPQKDVLHQVQTECQEGWWQFDAVASITTATGTQHQEYKPKAVHLTLAQCGEGPVAPGSSSASAAKGHDPCIFSFQPLINNDGRRIHGAGRVSACSAPPRRYEGVLHLQYRQVYPAVTDWSNEDQDSVYGTEGGAIVEANCKEGLWRMYLAVDGTDHDGHDFSVAYTNPPNPLVVKKCT